MQYGGTAPQKLQDGGVSTGLAYLKRGRKRKEARDEASKKRQTLAEKLGLSRTVGTVLGLGGGLLGAALAPATGGLSLALPALGTAIGKYTGSSLGYGEDLKVDDMMYGGEQGLYDVEDAGKSYKGSMVEDALASGAKAAFMAGLPGGGVYGKVAGKLRPDVASGAQSAVSGGTALGSATESALSNPPTLGMEFAPSAPNLTSGALTQEQGTLMDIIPSTLKTDSSDSVLSEASRISNIPDKIIVGSGTDITPNIEAIKSLRESEESLRQSSDVFNRMENSPYYQEVMGGGSEVVPESTVISQSPISNVAMPVDTNVTTPSYADALANRGQYQNMINQFFQQYSPAQRSEQNWMNMFEQPQIASLMGGGSVLQSPRTLLGFVG